MHLRTVEYSLTDFAVNQVAAAEMPEDREKDLNRSAGWQNIWDSSVNILYFTGFLAPRLSNVKFNSSDDNPLYCYDCQ